MDELEFEARLSARLHRHFDGVAPSPELRAGVDQVLSTQPQPIGLALLRARRRDVGWAAVVAAGLIVAVALTGGRLGGPFGPGAPSASPLHTQEPASTWRDFIVLPPAGHEPSKAGDDLASNVLNGRLRALFLITDGGLSFSSGGGYAVTFQVQQEGPPGDVVRSVLRAGGDVAFMALPGAGTDGAGPAAIGQNPPDGARTLFGWDGIAGASIETDQQGSPVLSITLRPAAGQTFADFTAAHVGETFAIVIDDDVEFLPVINEPIIDGKLQISAGGAFAESAAIIVGGKLPDAWILPTVPDVLPPGEIEREMEFEFSKVEPSPVIVDVVITSASLTSVLQGRSVVPAWYITIDGLAAACGTAIPSDERGTCRWTDPSIEHVYNAETGEWIGTAADFDESQ
jgi:hypothetical protein